LVPSQILRTAETPDCPSTYSFGKHRPDTVLRQICKGGADAFATGTAICVSFGYMGIPAKSNAQSEGKPNGIPG
jgi:hypothetical protein